jgi:hypothetical protein
MHTKDVIDCPLKKQMLFLPSFAYHNIMANHYLYTSATYLGYLHQKGFQELNTTSGRKTYLKLRPTYLGL